MSSQIPPRDPSKWPNGCNTRVVVKVFRESVEILSWYRHEIPCPAEPVDISPEEKARRIGEKAYSRAKNRLTDFQLSHPHCVLVTVAEGKSRIINTDDQEASMIEMVQRGLSDLGFPYVGVSEIGEKSARVHCHFIIAVPDISDDTYKRLRVAIPFRHVDIRACNKYESPQISAYLLKSEDNKKTGLGHRYVVSRKTATEKPMVQSYWTAFSSYYEMTRALRQEAYRLCVSLTGKKVLTNEFTPVGVHDLEFFRVLAVAQAEEYDTFIE